jgi:heme oxygenase
MSKLQKTSTQFDEIINLCKNIFLKKNKDYGTAWRILRSSSLTDQLFIKANRIRTIQELEQSKVEEGIAPEFIGIVNYSIMALIQLDLKEDTRLELSNKEVEEMYDKYASTAKKLMQDKNHDYGEAWRDMRVSSLCDLILMKILRVKQIEDNDGKTLISEGLDANYLDMLNYAVFALIKIELENEIN